MITFKPVKGNEVDPANPASQREFWIIEPVVDEETHRNLTYLMVTPTMDHYRQFILFCINGGLAFAELKDAKGLIRKYYGRKCESFKLTPIEDINNLIPFEQQVETLPMFCVYFQLYTASIFMRDCTKHKVAEIKAGLEIIPNEKSVLMLLRSTKNMVLQVNAGGKALNLKLENQDPTDETTVDEKNQYSRELRMLYTTFLNHIKVHTANYDKERKILIARAEAKEAELRKKVFKDLIRSVSRFATNGWTVSESGEFVYDREIVATRLSIPAASLHSNMEDEHDRVTIPLPPEMQGKFIIPAGRLRMQYQEIIPSFPPMKPAGCFHPHVYGGNFCDGDMAGKPFERLVEMPEVLATINYASMYANDASRLIYNWVSEMRALPKKDIEKLIRANSEFQEEFEPGNIKKEFAKKPRTTTPPARAATRPQAATAAAADTPSDDQVAAAMANLNNIISAEGVTAIHDAITPPTAAPGAINEDEFTFTAPRRRATTTGPTQDVFTATSATVAATVTPENPIPSRFEFVEPDESDFEE